MLRIPKILRGSRKLPSRSELRPGVARGVVSQALRRVVVVVVILTITAAGALVVGVSCQLTALLSIPTFPVTKVLGFLWKNPHCFFATSKVLIYAHLLATVGFFFAFLRENGRLEPAEYFRVILWAAPLTGLLLAVSGALGVRMWAHAKVDGFEIAFVAGEIVGFGVVCFFAWVYEQVRPHTRVLRGRDVSQD